MPMEKMISVGMTEGRDAWPEILTGCLFLVRVVPEGVTWCPLSL